MTHRCHVPGHGTSCSFAREMDATPREPDWRSDWHCEAPTMMADGSVHYCYLAPGHRGWHRADVGGKPRAFKIPTPVPSGGERR